MSLNLTTFDSMLKEHYTSDYIENLVFKDNPLLAMVPKYEDFGGRNLRVPLIYGNPQGRSASFAQAQSRGAATSSKLEDFVLLRVRDYSIATVDNETLEASKGNENAFMEALTTEIDGAINSLTRSIAVAMYGTGFGNIGAIAATSSVTTTVLTLANQNDITNFEVGMELVVATTVSSSTLKVLGTSGNGLIVTGIDRSAGTLTFGFNVNDAANGIPTIATGDVLFVRGDRQDSATPTALKISGLPAWVPYGGPSSAAFFSVDRTADSVRLGGLYYDGSGVPIEEALIEGAGRVAQLGNGKIDHYFMDYPSYNSLEKALGSKVQYIDYKVGQVAFRGMQVAGPRGMINVVPDQNCPSGTVFGLQLDMWKLYSLGKAVRVIEADGLAYLRQSSSDGIEVRYGFYGQMGCRAPGYNINIKVA